ncbi:MAG: SPOR domain-containing protein [Alistipes sp.]|nr:SPOR domain-containing protein [Alistipes sp.]
MYRKILLLLLMAACAVGVAEAQRIEQFKQHLASPVLADSLTTITTTVRVVEHGDVPTFIVREKEDGPKAVSGFRVMIFMSNSQSARTDALAARDLFDAKFPQERSYVTYENPYFKVAVGNCTSQEEALILLERLKGDFPKAFIMRENISFEELSR